MRGRGQEGMTAEPWIQNLPDLLEVSPQSFSKCQQDSKKKSVTKAILEFDLYQDRNDVRKVHLGEGWPTSSRWGKDKFYLAFGSLGQFQ